jgi:hypothetical protein
VCLMLHVKTQRVTEQLRQAYVAVAAASQRCSRSSCLRHGLNRACLCLCLLLLQKKKKKKKDA